MRVICIEGVKKGTISSDGTPIVKNEEIYEGEIYSVSGEYKYNGEEFYFLRERNPFLAYKKRRFAPLSDIDETELIKERELEKV